MQCITSATLPSNDGSSAVVLVPSSPADCPLIVVTQTEWSELEQKVSANPFFLSVEDGALISGAIVTLWCIAWAVRAVRRALD